ncbi:hypothetical protein PFISCL1PPCAC_14558, partial [Pristionchus fissidentatus]
SLLTMFHFFLLASIPSFVSAGAAVCLPENVCDDTSECANTPVGMADPTATCDPTTDPSAAPFFKCCIGKAGTTQAPTTVASGVTTTAVGSNTCVDKANPLTGVSDCPARASLCTDPVYLAVMKDQCPKTCGFCSSTGTGTTVRTGCVDQINPTTRVSDCPTMKAYCNNTVYMPLMRIQCPATCGFC